MYNLFRTKMRNNAYCSQKNEANFIIDGTSATKIFIWRLNVDKKAALIINDKEGPDSSIVYTHRTNNSCEELQKSDYFTWEDKIFFVYEDVTLVRDSLYKKQKAYQCNVWFKVGEECYYGYYVASLARYCDTNLNSNLVIDDSEKPILILPHFKWIKIGAKIVFGGKSWKIVDYDTITNAKIAYISLDRDFDHSFKDVNVDISEKPENQKTLMKGVENVLDIRYGYFRTSTPVNIIDKQLNTVSFITDDVDQLEVITLDENREQIKTIYRVV